MDWEHDGVRHTGCLVVAKVDELYGGLSNMSNDYPLVVNGAAVGSSEALYQACKYPDHPDWQRDIFAAPHAMQAKMKARKKERQAHARADWKAVNLDVMRWVLRVKLACHPKRFWGLVKWTAGKTVVERSTKDPFWGAVPGDDGVLRGENWLGRLIAELREETTAKKDAHDDGWLVVPPPAVPNFLLLGRPVEVVDGRPNRTKGL